MRAIKFKYEHEPHYQKVNHHPDGERLSAAPNAAKKINHNVFSSLIWGRLRNCNQNKHNEGHGNRHQNRNITRSPGAESQLYR